MEGPKLSTFLLLLSLFAISVSFSLSSADTFNELNNESGNAKNETAVDAESKPVGRPVSRVINGTFTTQQKYPYLLVLLRYNSLSCGASIISNYWALTAAHCVDHVPAWPHTSVRAGSSYASSGGSIHKVNLIKLHEFWKVPGKEGYDIAVMRVEQPFIFSQTVQPIPLPKYSRNNVGLKGRILGWGQTGKNEGTSEHLRYTDMTILSYSECAKSYSGVTQRWLCIQNKFSVQGVCLGDSGGPFVVNGEHYGVAALVWYSDGVCITALPSVYTNTMEHLNWIKAAIK